MLEGYQAHSSKKLETAGKESAALVWCQNSKHHKQRENLPLSKLEYMCAMDKIRQHDTKVVLSFVTVHEHILLLQINTNGYTPVHDLAVLTSCIT